MKFRILYQDKYFVAVDKPAGVFVHPPEDQTIRISKNQNGLQILRDQVGQYVYPVHRLDRATSGVVLYALDSETASRLHELLKSPSTEKTYLAWTRGWIHEACVIQKELDGKSARTEIEPLYRAELTEPMDDFPTTRYTWVKARIHEGRTHQIRRHLAGISHPIVGDTSHGDRRYNRLFREKLGLPGLFLKSYQLKIPHPVTEERVTLQSKYTKIWHSLFDLSGFCPRLEP